MDEASAELGRVTKIDDVEQLEELLSRPTPEVIETMGRLEGDLVVLGVGGKIGPSLARMARRASDAAGRRRRIWGVSRFSNAELPDRLRQQGIEPIRCELLDRRQLDALPAALNVLYLPAMKFGTTGQQPLTWAMNSYLPGMVCEKYAGSRIVAYSTGNVYPLVPVESGGSREEEPPAPIGDYAMSCLGRERIFSYFSARWGMPVALLRLNYAHEMRYGVTVDIALRVIAGDPVDVTMGFYNAIWQGDSNAMTLRAFGHAASPPLVLNLTGPATLRVRDVAEQIGRLTDRPPRIVGSEAPDALLSNARKTFELFGRPLVTEGQLIRWIADWHLRGGPTLGKPTQFETRNGTF